MKMPLGRLTRLARAASLGVVLGAMSVSLAGAPTPAVAQYDRERRGDYDHLVYTGVILHDVHHDTFNIRTERGRRMTVETDGYARGLREGDAIRVDGFWEQQPWRSHFHVTRLELLDGR